ncbi:MAG: hypothetical protein ACOCXT_05400 [Candidatus Dojkabacteria bacterium]
MVKLITQFDTHTTRASLATPTCGPCCCCCCCCIVTTLTTGALTARNIHVTIKKNQFKPENVEEYFLEQPLQEQNENKTYPENTNSQKSKIKFGSVAHVLLIIFGFFLPFSVILVPFIGTFVTENVISSFDHPLRGNVINYAPLLFVIIGYITYIALLGILREIKVISIKYLLLASLAYPVVFIMEFFAWPFILFTFFG